MAEQPGGGPGSQLVTGNPVLTPWAGQTGASTMQQTGQQERTVWDDWRELFQPVSIDIPPMPEPLPEAGSQLYGLRYNLTGGARPGQERAARAQRVREHEEAARGEYALRQEQNEQKRRLRELATKFFGRDPTPAEMQKLWFQSVDEAEAASMIGIEQDPWQALEGLANSDDRPGAGSEPQTSTTTNTTLNLTDPETAKGIIQTSLRDALGRRATDGEVTQFTAALNAAEEANPTVTTSTSTTMDGDTTTESQTTGGAPSPTAVATSWLDEELNAEIDVHRAGTEYFQAAQALAGGIA